MNTTLGWRSSRVLALRLVAALTHSTMSPSLDTGSYRSHHHVMKAVGVKILKNKLSEYLRLVREGEIVLVTDRGEVVAQITRPQWPEADRLSRWELFLGDEERAGHLTRQKVVRSLALEHLGSRPLPTGPDLLEILTDARADR